MKKIKKATAKQAYVNAQADIRGHLKKIAAGIDAQETDSPDWADVGDVQHLASILKGASDQLHHEGEYAELACLRCGKSYMHDEQHRCNRRSPADEGIDAARADFRIQKDRGYAYDARGRLRKVSIPRRN